MKADLIMPVDLRLATDNVARPSQVVAGENIVKLPRDPTRNSEFVGRQ